MGESTGAGTQDDGGAGDLRAESSGSGASESTSDTGPPVDGEVEILADGLALPWAFVVHPDWIYVTTYGELIDGEFHEGGLYRVPTEGGAPELLFGFDGQARWLAASEDELVWTSTPGPARRAALDGTNVVELTWGARPLAADATNIYAANNSMLLRIPLPGGPAQVIAQSGAYGAYEIALSETAVFWTTGTTVETVGKDGTGHTSLVTGQQYAGGVATDGETVFWFDHSENTLSSVPIAGGPATLLWSWSPVDDPSGTSATGGTAEITVDDTHVYWGGHDVVMRIAKDGGDAEIVASGEPVWYVRDVHVDATHVYWLNHTGACEVDTCALGSVARVGKPD